MLPIESKIDPYLGRSFSCQCGRTHRTDVEAVFEGKEAIPSLLCILLSGKYSSVLFVEDVNTHSCTAPFLEPVYQGLKKAGIDFRLLVFPEEEFHPDEKAVGRVLMEMDESTSLLIAVGSGSLNDVCKYVSFMTGRPCFVVATAASMDGYASNVAAMNCQHMKVTYPAHTPAGIFVDPEILALAPTKMNHAGFGDIAGKYTALADWKLSHLVTGEYFCSSIAQLMDSAKEQVQSLALEISQKDPKALALLTRALILSGIAMSFSGNSRPASGSEHHLSHYWEMLYLAQGKKEILHGIKVGIGLVLSLHLYQFISTYEPDFDSLSFSQLSVADDIWEEEMRRCFGKAAPSVILLERCTRKNGRENWEKRIAAIQTQWPRIQSLAASLPSPEEMEALLKKAGCPTHPADIGLDRLSVLDSLLYAKEVRNRYTVLQLLWDLGILKSCAENLVHQLYD